MNKYKLTITPENDNARQFKSLIARKSQTALELIDNEKGTWRCAEIQLPQLQWALDRAGIRIPAGLSIAVTAIESEVA